jgi:hypothetical protein
VQQHQPVRCVGSRGCPNPPEVTVRVEASGKLLGVQVQKGARFLLCGAHVALLPESSQPKKWKWWAPWR